MKPNSNSIYVIACSAGKAEEACPASELYRGQLFITNLMAARAIAPDDQIRILSAKFGILKLDQIVAPYDCSWESDDSIMIDELAMTCDDLIGKNVYFFGPKAYAQKLDKASIIAGAWCSQSGGNEKAFLVHEVAEDNAGIGEQRKSARLVREHGQSCPEAPATLNEICENIIAVDPWAGDIIRQETYSRPGCRIHFDHLREMVVAAFNLGQMTRTGSYRDVLKNQGANQ